MLSSKALDPSHRDPATRSRARERGMVGENVCRSDVVQRGTGTMTDMRGIFKVFFLKIPHDSICCIGYDLFWLYIYIHNAHDLPSSPRVKNARKNWQSIYPEMFRFRRKVAYIKTPMKGFNWSRFTEVIAAWTACSLVISARRRKVGKRGVKGHFLASFI